ncbi:MAG: hypothetical protein IPK87_00025 [Planctomycetes bacterium]|nr:hypothetical protein [Planctomycetota bacterium]
MIEAPCGPLATNQRNSSARTSASAQETGAKSLWHFTPNAAPRAGSAPTATNPASSKGKAQPHKLGSYHCWNRIYEPATGKWTAPDPAMSPWANLLAYAHDRPTSKTDSTGLDCTLTIVASEAADSTVREDIIAGFGTRCLATSAAGFKECFDEWKKDNPDCECLEAVTIIGESGSDFGGGEGFDKITTDSLIAMREMMCDEAQMEYRSCDGYANGWFWTLVYELQKGHSSITGTGYSGKCYPSGRYISGRKISTKVNFPDGTFHPKGRDEAGLALAGFVQCTARCLDTYYEALPMHPSAEEHQNESDKYWECVSQCRKNNIRGFWRFLFED